MPHAIVDGWGAGDIATLIVDARYEGLGVEDSEGVGHGSDGILRKEMMVCQSH